MAKLPVIVGIGGINAAGRSSSFHSYKRMVHEALSEQVLKDTWWDLAHRMGLHVNSMSELTSSIIDELKEGTLVRKIKNFDVTQVPHHHQVKLNPHASFMVKKSKLSSNLSKNGQISAADDEHEVLLTIDNELPMLLPDTFRLSVSSAGCLPQGFDPSQLYNAHHHPRGLSLAVYGASDALNSLGFEWEDILAYIQPDEVSVYAGSALGQIDEHSLAGMISQPLCGHRINSKMMPLALAEMPADFINSYVINSVGNTGHNVGACATFLYNLRQGILDIRHGYAKVAIIGSAEAAVQPDIIEGFRVMGALATDESLCKLDGNELPNHRRACRPFSTNTGFTLAEAAQFIVLMDDELALRLGAHILGSVADVFVNADANKKSIASPGIGNYVTMAKAAALTKSILGEEGLQRHTYVQAHGTGTPQNRTTESHILNEVAKTFGIKNWPVSAVKAYVGHSIGAAGGDQMLAALGIWQYGWIPGIKTIDHIAEDVHQSNLNILMEHHCVNDPSDEIKAAIINSKGFGGNNASAVILSPQQTLHMLKNKYGEHALASYLKKHHEVEIKSAAQDKAACSGQERMIYKFGESVMDQSSVTLSSDKLKLSEFVTAVDLTLENPYETYC